MANILVATEAINPDNGVGGLNRFMMLLALLKAKHNVTALFPKECIRDSNPVKNINVKTITLEYPSYKPSLWNKIPKIRALNTLIKGKDPIFLHKARIWKTNIEKILSEQSIDYILTLGAGEIYLPHWAMLEVKTKVPWITFFHDPYPVSMAPEPYKKSHFPFDLMISFKVKKMIKKSIAVTYPSELIINKLSQNFKELNKKSYVLPHTRDENYILNLLQDEKKEITNNDKFVITHVGRISRFRNPWPLMKAIIRLMEEDMEFKQKCKAKFIGDFDIHNPYYDYIKKLPDNFNIINQRVNYKNALLELISADLAVIIEANGPYSPFMPGKLADILFFEKPLLALTPKISEIRRIMGDEYPYLATPENEEEIFQALKKAWDAWKNNRLNLENSKKLRKYISSSFFIEQFNKIIS